MINKRSAVDAMFGITEVNCFVRDTSPKDRVMSMYVVSYILPLSYYLSTDNGHIMFMKPT